MLVRKSGQSVLVGRVAISHSRLRLYLRVEIQFLKEQHTDLFR